MMQTDVLTASEIDWSQIHFSVSCGRCGVNLRGCHSDECPACGIDLDWGTLLPLADLRCLSCGYQLLGLTGSRCPECGDAILWEEAAIAARRKGIYRLFEYAWSKRPVRSLWSTWRRAAFHPRELWADYSIHDQPIVGSLLLFALLQWIVFGASWFAVGAIADFAMNEISIRLNLGNVFNYDFRLSRDFFFRAFIWYWMTFASFQLFIITKEQYAVRWTQIFRVYVHSTAFLSLCMLFSIIVEIVMDFVALAGATDWARRTYVTMQLGILWLGIAATWFHIWTGYHRYLQIPRGWGTAIMCMVLGHLLTRVTMVII